MTTRWVDLGLVADLPEGKPALRKADGERYACVRDDRGVTVLADRCPHEGYPLSQGEVREGVLTCAWHNWKFDCASGECITGGDAVRRFPVRIDSGRLYIDAEVDEQAQRARFVRGIEQGLFDDDQTRVVRDGLRMAHLSSSSLEEVFGVVVGDAARRGRWGFGHELATVVDILRGVDDGDLDGVDALALTAALVGERLAREPARPRSSSSEGELPEGIDVWAALRDERREVAESAVRRVAAEDGADVALRHLVPFVASDLLDYGHGAIYLAKARELAHRFPGLAEELCAALTVTLSWATHEIALPGWGDTRKALEHAAVLELSLGQPVDLAGLVPAILASEKSATEAVVQALESGDAPEPLLRVIGCAAAHRLASFDPAWSERRDANVTLLDVTHAVTFVEAALSLLPIAEAADRARFAILAAGFVGKLHRADATPPGQDPGIPDAPVTRANLDALVKLVARRDEPAAHRMASSLPDDVVPFAFTRLRSFAAFEASVRPIFIAHAIKTLEALRRLASHDSEHARVYLTAAIHLLAPRWRERFTHRTAEIARQFISDGRPPPGLY
jgi:nitrite reductase/ring-hydroxylating ferredoxin subunit